MSLMCHSNFTQIQIYQLEGYADNIPFKLNRNLTNTFNLPFSINQSYKNDQTRMVFGRHLLCNFS